MLSIAFKDCKRERSEAPRLPAAAENRAPAYLRQAARLRGGVYADEGALRPQAALENEQPPSPLGVQHMEISAPQGRGRCV